MIPPTRPQYPGWASVEEALSVQSDPIEPVFLGPDPTPHRLAWFGLGVCVGVLLLALLILVRVAIDGAAG